MMRTFKFALGILTFLSEYLIMTFSFGDAKYCDEYSLLLIFFCNRIFEFKRKFLF